MRGIQSTFLIRPANSQSSSYPVVLTRLGGPHSWPNPLLKSLVPGIEPAILWSMMYDYIIQNIISMYIIISISLQPLFLCRNSQYKYLSPHIIPDYQFETIPRHKTNYLPPTRIELSPHPMNSPECIILYAYIYVQMSRWPVFQLIKVFCPLFPACQSSNLQ